VKKQESRTCDGALLAADSFETLFVVGSDGKGESITVMLKMSQNDKGIEAVRKLFITMAHGAERLVSDNREGGAFIVKAIIGGLNAGMEVAESESKE